MSSADVPPIDPAKAFHGSIVVAAPHMDDEVLACGGTIARLPDKHRVHVVYATDGSQSPVPTFPSREAAAFDLTAIRTREAKAALHVLGIPDDNVHFWNLPDGTLRHHGPVLCDRLTELMETVKPAFLFVPFRFDRHPDHLALNRAATAVVRQPSCAVDLIEYFVYYRWALLPGRDVRRFISPEHLVQVDIQAQASQKREALECFKSQTTLFYAWQDRPILPPQRVVEVSRSPEYFLTYDPRFPASSVFARAGAWIRLVHAAEPTLKRRKDELFGLVRRTPRADAGKSKMRDQPGGHA